jgi:hypothetical protein
LAFVPWFISITAPVDCDALFAAADLTMIISPMFSSVNGPASLSSSITAKGPPLS